MTAVVQFLMLDYMPFWSSIDNGMSKQRLVDVNIVDEGKWCAASYYSIEKSTKLAIDLSVLLLDPHDPNHRIEIRQSGLTTAKVSPTGSMVALGYRDGSIILADPEDASEPKQTIPKPPAGQQVRDFHWSSDGQFLLIRLDRTGWIWDSASGSMLKELAFDANTEVVIPGNSDCFAVCVGGAYQLFEWKSGQSLQSVPIEITARSVTFSSDLKYAAYLLGTELKVIDFCSGIPVWGKSYRVTSTSKVGIAFSTDDRAVAFVQHDTYSGDYCVKLVDIGSESEIGSQVFGKNSIIGLAFQNDSIWAWECNGRICKWDSALPADHVRLVLRTQVVDSIE